MATVEAAALAQVEQAVRKVLPSQVVGLLAQRDGAARLLEELPRLLRPSRIGSSVEAQEAWEGVGNYYRLLGRLNEAIPIFSLLYKQMLQAQVELGRWVHKGMPLVWLNECFWAMGWWVHAKRFIMLTLLEDAIREKGTVSPATTGVYFRIVWRHGLSDDQVKRYAARCYEIYSASEAEARYPEWILQQMDLDWMTEFPSPSEAPLYLANTEYVKFLIDKLGDPSGRTLEFLAQYLLSCMPGCRTTRRRRTFSTDYDLVCSMEGFDLDFRSELGRYFVCECKDWGSPADFTTMAKFCRVLDSIKARFGIVFSRSGVSGQGQARYAAREQLKVFQDRGMVIVVVDGADLRRVEDGDNFTSLLRSKYEQVRLDLFVAEEDTTS